MFWRFGGYANISTIDTILDKQDFQLEDLLDESDLIQELKQHNAKLVEYLRNGKILEKLLAYVIAPKLEPVEDRDEDREDEDTKGKGRARLSFGRSRASSRATNEGDHEEEEREKKRNRYAYVAAEVLSSDNWSIYEALVENPDLLRNFWAFLKLPPPLDPLQASYFTKVNEALFDKKTDQMLELLKSLDDAVPDILRHVDCPMIMDLLLKIISLERTDSGQGIVEWLYTKHVMPTLLAFLGPEHSWATQTSAGDFIKAIITVSANASQNEQACIGPNELTRQLVSKPCVEQLVGYMLQGGNPLTVGVGIIIEVIRKNNSDYDPDVGPDNDAPPSSRDPIYLGTLLRLFAEHVPDFMNLILNTPIQQQRLDSTFGDRIEPLGFDRFKTCELMAELLHCSNMALLNEVGSEQLIALRDEERARMRTEGRLAASRVEETQSSEDLVMRGRHSSPDDGRRLEVTNASDDDGFEEVTPSGEMTEDTSHEFVNAAEEIQTGPTSSFLDKDEDDFVDEPLSSPRLHVHDGRVNEQQFDNPQFVPAPLSPRKGLPQTEALAKSGDDTAEEKTGDVPEAARDVAMPDAEAANDKEPGQPASEHLKADPGSKTDESSFAPIELDSTTKGDSQGKDADASVGGKAPGAESAQMASASEDEPMPDATTISEAPEGKTEEASIIVGHEAEPPTLPAAEQLKPVVGDFLKMQFVEHKVVPTILSFFFKYPWNNFLHNVVYDIVQQVFNGPMDRGYNPTLAISLFEAADVTNAIIKGQKVSEDSQTMSRTRMGYMGHLTLIAEEVVKFTERNPPELLSELVLDRVMSQDWINYVEGALAETRERDNAILGGVRPDAAMDNRAAMAGNGLGNMGLGSLGLSQGGSNALAEAGLNGGANDDNGSGSSIGPFSISHGPLSGSGFGSSSDEDEDEPEENEEDVKNEFRAYTDPLHASSTSMDPPSVPPPPPPPPLNIPPSRARLQLAARLAMHQKGGVTASAQSAEIENDDEDDEVKSSGEPDSMLRDPFADDAEDDDSDDGLGEEGGDTSAWNAPSRGSWWRNTLTRGGKEKFGDGRDDSDSGQDENEHVDNGSDDEEFGDFAMPEVDKDNGGDGAGTSTVVVKPLPLHPAGQSSSKSSSFTSLWPFSGQGFGSKDKDKDKDRDRDRDKDGDGDGEKDKDKDKDVEKEKDKEKTEKTADDRRSVDKEVSLEPEEITGENGEKITKTHEAVRRTSIEDPDEEEVVV